MVLLALLPIIWLIVALGFLKLPGYKACPVAVIISAVVAVAAFGMPGTDAATAFLEGVALAVWPILLERLFSPIISPFIRRVWTLLSKCLRLSARIAVFWPC